MALSASDAVTFPIDRSTPRPGIVLNEHYDGEGDIVYKYACKLTLQRSAPALAPPIFLASRFTAGALG
jgi:hypothetical protein